VIQKKLRLRVKLIPKNIKIYISINPEKTIDSLYHEIEYACKQVKVYFRPVLIEKSGYNVLPNQIISDIFENDDEIIVYSQEFSGGLNFSPTQQKNKKPEPQENVGNHLSNKRQRDEENNESDNNNSQNKNKRPNNRKKPNKKVEKKETPAEETKHKETPIEEEKQKEKDPDDIEMNKPQDKGDNKNKGKNGRKT